MIAEARVYGVNKRADVPPVHSVGSKGYDADRRPDPTPNDTQVLRGLGIANPALLDQPYGLKLELPRKLPPLHDAPPVPLKHLTWCLRNRVQAIHAQEQGKPKNRKKINWKLLIDLTVRSRKDAIEKLEWYAMRWKIEMFHKILKSGCRAEESRLRTAERLANLISLFCILSWRIFWMTMLNRSAPTAPQSAALTETEIELLDQLVKNKGRAVPRRKTLYHYLTKIARLGGYLARANDPPPGNIVMWRGLSRLNDIELGALAGAKIVGT